MEKKYKVYLKEKGKETLIRTNLFTEQEAWDIAHDYMVENSKTINDNHGTLYVRHYCYTIEDLEEYMRDNAYKYFESGDSEPEVELIETLLDNISNLSEVVGVLCCYNVVEWDK